MCIVYVGVTLCVWKEDKRREDGRADMKERQLLVKYSFYLLVPKE